MRMAAHDETHCIPKRHISCREAADEAVDAAVREKVHHGEDVLRVVREEVAILAV